MLVQGLLGFQRRWVARPFYSWGPLVGSMLSGGRGTSDKLMRLHP